MSLLQILLAEIDITSWWEMLRSYCIHHGYREEWKLIAICHQPTTGDVELYIFKNQERLALAMLRCHFIMLEPAAWVRDKWIAIGYDDLYKLSCVSKCGIQRQSNRPVAETEGAPDPPALSTTCALMVGLACKEPFKLPCWNQCRRLTGQS